MKHNNEIIPDGFFLSEENLPKSIINDRPRPLLAYRDTRRATILVKRTVIGPFVNRHTTDEDTITIMVRNESHIRIPNRKLKAVEKNRCLRMARKHDLVDPQYLTNEVQEIEHLANPVSVLYGDGSNKTNEVAGIPARVIYSQAVSIQPKKESIQHITHNALSDEKTMRNVAEFDKAGKTTMRTSLFETAYVREGTAFLSTITIDTPTLESLTLVLYGLQAGSYGAGSNVYGTNLRNEVLGIALTKREIPVTPWSSLHEHEIKNVDDAVKNFVDEIQTKINEKNGEKFLDSTEVQTLQTNLLGSMEDVVKAMTTLSKQAKEYVDVVFGSVENKKSKKTKEKEAEE